MAEAPVRKVAAFDFDGTITRRDTLVPFLARACGPHRLARAIGSYYLAGLRDRRGRAGSSTDVRPAGRDGLKTDVLSALFRGDDPARVDDLARQHAVRVERLIRPEMRERIAWHREQNHETVIVSASLAAYLRPIATQLGIDDVIAVELEAGPDGRLTGAMSGLNVRADEKAARLRAWLGDRPASEVELWAYGDSSGDDALLAMADHPMWLGRRAKRNPA